MSEQSEYHGAIVRGNRVTIICADCGRFVKHGDETARVRYSPVATEPEYDFVHKVCPPKKERKRG